MTQLLDPPAGASPAPGADAAEAFEAASAGMAGLVDAPLWPLGSEGLVAVMDRLQVLRRQAEAVQLRLLREIDSRGVPAEQGARSVKDWLRGRYRCTGSQAHADAAAAAATCPARGELAELGAALAAGEISRAHLDVAVRVMQRIPRALATARRAEVADWLLDACHRFSTLDVDRLARQLLAALDPDGGFDPHACERRRLSKSTDSAGMLVGRFQLDQAAGLTVAAALDHFAAPRPSTADGDGADRDPRSAGQRYADALELIARLAMAADGAGTRAGEPARVVIHTTPEQLAGVPGAGVAVTDTAVPVSRAALLRLCCDAIIQRVTVDRHGLLLNLGRAARFASTAQRQALAVRDGGCAMPGCDAPPSWCEAHHIEGWTEGGPTDLANLVLLCPHHHTQVDLGRWQITIKAGLPWFIPPRHVDPRREPRRNTVHQAHRHARHLGNRLRDHHDGDHPPP